MTNLSGIDHVEGEPPKIPLLWLYSFGFCTKCLQKHFACLIWWPIQGWIVWWSSWCFQGDDQDLDDRVIRQLWEDNKELREEVRVCFTSSSLLYSLFVNHPFNSTRLSSFALITSIIVLKPRWLSWERTLETMLTKVISFTHGVRFCQCGDTYHDKTKREEWWGFTWTKTQGWLNQELP